MALGLSSRTKLDRDEKALMSTPVLKLYDVHQPVTVSVDASSHGLGAALIQNKQPVAYASRALTPAEQNYAQTEKEMLAIVFRCEQFHDYIYGKKDVLVETDHKPLETILKKPLYMAPQRL